MTLASIILVHLILFGLPAMATIAYALSAFLLRSQS